MRLLSFCLTLLVFIAATGDQTFAADLAGRPAPAPLAPGYSSFISELRLGVFAHDPSSPESGSVDINGEILSIKPFTPADPLIAFLVPRLHLGGTLNTAGDTSHVYTGLTWTYDITTKLFVEGSIGVAFHNGKTGVIVPSDRSALGCSPLVRESGSIGYRIDANWSVMATIEHMSNGGSCGANRGLTNYGVRVGYVF